MSEANETSMPGVPDFTTGDIERQRRLVGEVNESLGITDDILAALVVQQMQNEQLERAELEILREIRDIRQIQESDSDVIGEFPIGMGHNVPADTKDTDPAGPKETERVPNEDGPSRITAVTYGFQDQTDGSTALKLRTESGLDLIPKNPEDNFMALDGSIETFPMDAKLKKGEKIVAETVNFDSNSDHWCTLIPHVEVIDMGTQVSE